jgi:hypothetical protein
MVKARLKTVQTGFSAGEVGAALKGGFDNDLYFKGAEKLRNVYVNPQQHLTRREGTKYIANTTGNAASRLVEFEFSTTQKYLLVFTAGQFKVFKDDVLQATVTASPISSLTLSQIETMEFTQSANKLFLFHKDFRSIEITRTSHTVWTVGQVNFDYIPWFAFAGLTISTPSGHLTPAVTSGRDALFTAQHSHFNSGHVGQYIYGKQGGIARITSVISATQIRCRIEVDFPSTNNIPEFSWELETGYEPTWSDSRGWPSCGTFHQNRLWLANSGQRPQSIWGSAVGDFFNFDIGSSADDDAIDFTLDDNAVNAILYLVSGRNLQIYTTGGEFFIATAVGTPVTPNSLSITKATSHGSSNVRPKAVGGVVLFVEVSGSVIREFVYNDLEQNYQARNISVLSPHLIVNPVSVAIRSSRATSPADYYFAVNSDGTLAVLSVAKSQELLAWSLFETDGAYEKICTVGSEVYVIVRRIINGSTVRFIEKFDGAYSLDASVLATNGSPTTSWSGLSYLNGHEVTVKGDDFILEKEVVSSGGITSSQAVSEIEVGLSFFVIVRLLPIQTELNGQSMAGDYKRVVFLNLLLLNARHIVIKVGDKKYVPSFDSFGANVLDTPVSLYTGWKKIYLAGVGRDTQIEITQEQPLEFNLLAAVVAIK